MKTTRKRSASKGTAFVPRIVFQSLMVGLVPAVAAGCASTASGDASVDNQVITLAMIGFDADAATDAASDVVPDRFIGVADTGFDAGFRDEGIIVLAQIGFEIDPEAKPDRVLANTPTPSRDRASRTPRRGRA